MSETVLQDGDVIARAHGGLRRITLNRPKALNAITLDMVATMTTLMLQWADDPAVGAVMIDGAGGRGLAAGGDIRAIYDAAKVGGSLPAQFWATEYKLNVLVARYPKPVVAIMDGLVMGGGVGLSAHTSHRIVTERSAVAMPEVQIGYFPDVGACFVLARSPGFTGTHLALTGMFANAADAIYSGLADLHIPVSRLDELPAALAGARGPFDAKARLDKFSTPPAVAGSLAAARPWIDRCFAADTVEEIVARLTVSDEEEAGAALEAMQRASPTSLKITLRNIRSALSFEQVEQSFQQDYRVSLACVAEHDFIEGIRAAIVDKDRNPVWCPDTLEAVTPDIVERHFRSVGALELRFER